MTPPSELMRPPSKAAVTWRRETAGKVNGRRVSSDMAGVALSDAVAEMVSAPKSYAGSETYATPAAPSKPPS
jgi:hypothetical protein